jgi:ABC-type glycerol-3-phosphate transport system permease component
MRQYLIGIPQEVLDAARVDGASDLGIYWRIVMPMAWPVTAAMGILTFVGSWNNLLWPLIVIQSAQLFTLPLGLTQFSSQYFTNYVDVLALSLVSIVPVIILFLIVRRRLLDAIMVGGGSVTG